MRKYQKRFVAVVILVALLVQTIGIRVPVYVSAEETSIFTNYFPKITEVTDASGFKHPSVGLTKDLLENVRTKVRAKAEPWNTYFNAMLTSNTASANVVSNNQSAANPAVAATVAFNSQSVQSKFITDALRAYTQALLYYITGADIYRANALHIIRIWSQMDPAQFTYYTDACIHSGIPLNRMLMAAEILRYSSCNNKTYVSAAGTTENLNWTDTDTKNFTNNLINPMIETLQHDQNHFMNQHMYPLIGAMSGYIFTGNRTRYNEAVEWYTVNSTANDQGFNGSIKQLFRWVDEIAVVGNKIGQGTKVTGHVQHVEMGRDQAHGSGDLTNAAIINRMLLAQGTKVDPAKGTVSTSSNAVGPYEFLDNRILGAAEFFWQYMLGYETEWTPVAYSIAGDGTIRDTYNRFSLEYRGRFQTANFWDLYSYYTYVKKQDMSKIAPYYYEAFTKKLAPTASGWENVDAGTDFWLYLPAEAETDAKKFLPNLNSSGSLIEVEDRYTSLDSSTKTLTENNTTYIRFNASGAGSKIVLLSLGQGSKTYGVKLRSNGTATLEMLGQTLTVSNTNGQWKYFTVTGNFGDFAPVTIKGASGVTVDMDCIDANAANVLTPPVFKTGTSDLNVFVYSGVSLDMDFSALDSNAKDVVTYEGFSMPQGSSLNKNTGIFTWKPTQAGKSSFIIAASDGVAVTARNVNISVSANRNTAITEVLAPYNATISYEYPSLEEFKKVHKETVSKMNTASDKEFCEQLLLLRIAVENLKLTTPLLSDGSIDYSKIVTSTLGTDLSWLVDGDNATFGGFKNGRENLWHTIDFGVDYKVSISKFGLQSRMNFVDRAAGSVLYGSNDNENWTRLTPGETAFTPEMSIIPVDEKYKNEKYRYLKIFLINPQRDIIHNSAQMNIELGELRLWGVRYDAGNMISSVSISSDQSVAGRIQLGDTAKLTIQTREAVKDMAVTIQGLPAMLTTTDNINWTAVASMTKGVEAGNVTFTVDYHRQDGSAGDTISVTTDNSKLFLVDKSDFIEHVLDITDLIDSTTGRSQADTLNQTKNLFDNNASTSSDYRTDNGLGGLQGWGGSITFDFKVDNQISLRMVEIQARQDQVSRIKGTVIQGSNDNVNFVTISTEAIATAEWQTLTINDNSAYRYIRVYNAGNWYGNMAELAFYGEIIRPINILDNADLIDSTPRRSQADTLTQTAMLFDNNPSTSSDYRTDNGSGGVQGWGGYITFDFKAGNQVSLRSVKIQARQDQVSRIKGTVIQGSNDNVNFDTISTAAIATAEWQVLTINDCSAYRYIRVYNAGNWFGNMAELRFYGEVVRPINMLGITDLIDSTPRRSQADTLTQTLMLFDNNASTSSDYRTDNGSGGVQGWGGYITFDFKAGNQVSLRSVKIQARQDQVSRIKGTVIQGSNDNVNFNTISTAAIATAEWQTLTINDNSYYRYIRVYNAGNWFGNMAELAFYGECK
ncbi:discoidin domain-containing protein [Anaerosporobacter sp.]|uniref:discoidin domain-containing protein n=1 Tax=Anaerosporobacter sp. TaxID=1872529 RepID=UPI00286F3CAC|nr:discoidin domain-containing protein [Anaerosporobacter sp.]